MRGRKPIPTQIHRLRGTLNATRHASRKNEPKAAGALTARDAPVWFGAEERAAWGAAIKDAPAGVLRKIDKAILVAWVLALCEVREARGGRDLHSLHRASLRLTKIASELGFTPASRSRVEVNPDAAAASPWEEFSVIDGGRKA